MFALIYGFLAQLAYAPVDIWIFFPIALALIIKRTHKKSFKARSIDGFLFSLGFTLVKYIRRYLAMADFRNRTSSINCSIYLGYESTQLDNSFYSSIHLGDVGMGAQ